MKRTKEPVRGRKRETIPHLSQALRQSILQKLGAAEAAGQRCTLAGLIRDYRGEFTPAMVREAVEELQRRDQAQTWPGTQTARVMVGLSRRLRGASR